MDGPYTGAHDIDSDKVSRVVRSHILTHFLPRYVYIPKLSYDSYFAICFHV